ncbi:MAG TPA: hypothetical protein VFQ07_12445 [Candidatus Polarisedimenticolia bacterium]|nr:hypothetical protein [Candidatus Polarisedimenticolia bacterium]
MLKSKSHFTLAVVLVAAAMVVAGGVVTASNTGFKMNKPLAPSGAGQIGNNWTSVPYFNPYGNVGAFCSQTGLITSGTLRDTVADIDPVTGVTTTVTCGTAGANGRAIVAGRGIRIRRPSTVVGTTSIIIVGSHNPSQSITVPDAGTGAVGTLWFSVPYHTTAVTAADLCLSSGLTSSGTLRATIARLNATNGVTTTVTCGTAGAGTLSLTLGEAVAIREPNGPLSFIPAHF